MLPPSLFLATRDTIDMTTKMAEAGADAALVVTPCFYKNGMTSEALEKHFTKVSDKITLISSSPRLCDILEAPCTTPIWRHS